MQATNANSSDLSSGRFSPAEVSEFVSCFRRDGFIVLPGHFHRVVLEKWREAFQPLFDAQVGKNVTNRGAARIYITLPFAPPFNDPRIYEDPDILAIVDQLVGPQPVMCQLASDTPYQGSDYQPVHRDNEPLFPEANIPEPPYQLAVNFSLVDITAENGPLEISRGTYMLTGNEGFEGLETGRFKLEALHMKVGDVLIRDVRCLHRGTPNKTDEPRPMVVVGYSRRWLYRPEVGMHIPLTEWDKLSPMGRRLLRFNTKIKSLDEIPSVETYDADLVPGLAQMGAQTSMMGP